MLKKKRRRYMNKEKHIPPKGMVMAFKCSPPDFFSPRGFLNIINASDRCRGTGGWLTKEFVSLRIREMSLDCKEMSFNYQEMSFKHKEMSFDHKEMSFN